MRRTLKGFAVLGVVAVAMTFGPGSSTARAQLFRGSGYYGGGNFYGGGYYFERFVTKVWYSPFSPFTFSYDPFMSGYPVYPYLAAYPYVPYVNYLQNSPAPKIIVPKDAAAPPAERRDPPPPPEPNPNPARPAERSGTAVYRSDLSLVATPAGAWSNGRLIVQRDGLP